MTNTVKKDIRSSILDEAKSIVVDGRVEVFGGIEDSFQNVASLWGGYKGVEFTPVDVAIMLILLKIARIKKNSDHRDSWVDIAGYAACGAECGLK